MELFFCQSPTAQEKSRGLPRMGCLLSLNTFLVTLQQFPPGGLQFCPVLWAALCCPLADREQGRFLCLNLFRPWYFKRWLLVVQEAEGWSWALPQHLSQACLCLSTLLQGRAGWVCQPGPTPWHFQQILKCFTSAFQEANSSFLLALGALCQIQADLHFWQT